MYKESYYSALFERFRDQRIMVIGDVMVDAYFWGRVERISPEAPVPIVTVTKKENRLGGAANVARNLLEIGAEPILCSVIGDDENGDAFVEMLIDSKMRTDGICVSKNRITTTKVRIFGNNHHLLRVDEEIDRDLEEEDAHRFLLQVFDFLDNANIDAIIFQDYNKGILSKQVIDAVIRKAREKNIPVAVDPKKKNFREYQGVQLFKPNLKELREGLKMDVDAGNREELIRAAQILLDTQHIDMVMITMGDKGIFISASDGDRSTHIIPAHLRTVADVSGAGDTVISVAALCLSSKCSPFEIAAISNLAGGLPCEEVGVVPINREKLLAETLKLL